MNELGLYIHVPFCASRCAYCDFYSTTDTLLIDEYVEALLRQIPCVADSTFEDDRCASSPRKRGSSQETKTLGLDSRVKPENDKEGTFEDKGKGTVSTIYFGGGTPSLLGGRLPRIMEAIRQHFIVADDAEITVEVNPDSCDETFLAACTQAGVTRLSIGVQSLNDDTLRFLGRRHTAQEARDAVAAAVAAGFTVSADVIVGVAGIFCQTEPVGAGIDDFFQLVSLGAKHVSVYPLTIEPGTELARRVDAGTWVAPDEDTVADAMEAADDCLSGLGFNHYEIANYALPGYESRHNCRYWTGGDYLGLGPSAVSMRNGGDSGRTRFTLQASLKDYLAKPERSKPVESERLTEVEAGREDVMLAMRLARGVEVDRADALGLSRIFAELARDGLVELVADGTRLRCTQRGWMLGNEVFGRILFA
ncbi:MAG: coproporphyrinogen III oxidase family protein [Actinomycetes bacterium]|jgi:oxygen-independent coproporphyrinogen-3 oxidase|nr:coproporphyrinogen III oxidase family protein [Actinomycetes bacterium]